MIMGQYEAIYMPDHPKATKTTGCVYLHILIAEKMIGRYLKQEVVHHINENKLDNSPSNLMIFKTKGDHNRFHKGYKAIESEKNIFVCLKVEYFCKKCNKQISKNQSFCAKCASEIRRVVERPLRKELKQLIRVMPFTDIGKKFGVSDNAIRKWCKSYNLPFSSKEIKQLSNEEWDKI